MAVIVNAELAASLKNLFRMPVNMLRLWIVALGGRKIYVFLIKGDEVLLVGPPKLL